MFVSSHFTRLPARSPCSPLQPPSPSVPSVPLVVRSCGEPCRRSTQARIPERASPTLLQFPQCRRSCDRLRRRSRSEYLSTGAQRRLLARHRATANSRRDVVGRSPPTTGSERTPCLLQPYGGRPLSSSPHHRRCEPRRAALRPGGPPSTCRRAAASS